MTITEQIRTAAQSAIDAGQSVNDFALKAGITQPILHRFLGGGLPTAKLLDSLAAHLGLELRPIDSTAAEKAKVKAPAIPAVDWSTTEPKKKPKRER